MRLITKLYDKTQDVLSIRHEPLMFRYSHNNEYVGCFGLNMTYNLMTLWNMFVPSSQRNKGFGKALMLKAISIAKRCHCKNLSLFVEEDNYVAKHLYRSMGFRGIRAHRHKKWNKITKSMQHRKERPCGYPMGIYMILEL